MISNRVPRRLAIVQLQGINLDNTPGTINYRRPGPAVDLTSTTVPDWLSARNLLTAATVALALVAIKREFLK
jgi:hypothetical protein